ncbi:hypothetical protein G8O24_38730 [Bradyrhizobium sp. INPA01-394B]|uniref:Uncharacterized protein n=1 Tax=Bradyrhizobium campsiandrae TaxID=1729892 RepID=A0ABR7UEZ9_9BRAD|nr:hypothetical protein [Bradyrhizobium campsiandrae]MBC9883228.1 hypothetical protein [Bradyrhizobium campsiandrae]MBC9982176.1 hypothetical protein [Bradyrhizobium campsiandrae]
MTLIQKLFGKKPITSTAIATEIEKARAEHDAVLAKRGAALAGLGLMDDAAHQKAEAEYEVHRRAADRAAARLADLGKAHAEALATEAGAEKQAEAERFRQRVTNARSNVEVEAVALLREYDATAAKLGDIIARLGEIDTEASAVNEAGRRAPGFEPVRSIDAAHRQHPGRQASERREMQPCWVFSNGDVLPVRTNASGNVIKEEPRWVHHEQRFDTPRREQREIVVSRTEARAGHYEAGLAGIVLPPGFARGSAHWPRKS